jgi:transcriptional regulator with XRE-family HTH domain
MGKVGELARLDRTCVSSAEHGHRNASLKAIQRLAEALGVDPSELV